MTKKLFGFLLLFMTLGIFAQKKSKEFRSKNIIVATDTIAIDSLSISSHLFKVFNTKQQLISSNNYQVDFGKAQLIISKEKHPQITIEYYRYPDFLTKVYSPLSKNLIVPTSTRTGKLYSATTNKKKSDIQVLDGLHPQGFISRGITTGNNQDAVTNSSLDLSLNGKLSKDISIRANIFDTNFPLQENGYSQNITDFDRVFIEMYSKNWKVTGGDLSLQNSTTNFLPFKKQVSGIQIDASIKKNTKIMASGAIVKGKFSSFNWTGIEGNQGPYKIYGPNNESAIIIIDDSDKVYVNGILLERGETKDYSIDYNLAEIKFNTTFPITNDMRIRVEFQYSENSYNRFITYDAIEYTDDDLQISGYFYSESDAKNQSVQQSLSDEQKQILADAGNDNSKMITESANESEYSESIIQYTKQIINNQDVFVYSPVENDELYNVTFTNVGTNQGSYVMDSTIAIGTIYSYVGENLGDYEPITFLIAPQKLQVAVAKIGYEVHKNSKLNAEMAVSNYDANLFSTIDDEQNKNVASIINWQQILIDKKWQLTNNSYYRFIQENFTSVQRFRTVEFDRDWNITNTIGDQQQFGNSLSLIRNRNFVTYSFEHLSFSDSFKGNKHSLTSVLKHKNNSLTTNGSLLQNTSNTKDDNFLRLQSSLEYSLGKPYLGAFINLETNNKKNKITNTYETTSHRFKEYESYLVLGDSTKLSTKIGVNYRENDSIINNAFTEINNRKTLYINSKLIESKNTNLSLYTNYIYTNNNFEEDEKTLNSKINYNQRFLNNFFTLSTIYENLSGNLAQQNYVYIETETGQGYYTWIDYNTDGIQDFDEFEIAQYQDQANYLRVALPNINYLQTQKAKLKQSFTINPYQWSKGSGLKKQISHFYNQTYISIENEQEKSNRNFLINPYNTTNKNLLGLNYNLRNNFYFNKGLQNYSLTYTYGKTNNTQQYSIGNQDNFAIINQLKLEQKFLKNWLLDLTFSTSKNILKTENLLNRNYDITNNELNPKLTFSHSKNQRFSLFYQLKLKENLIEGFEKLYQQKTGVDYFFLSKKQNQITANFTAFFNDFTGDSNSPVSYQMLEGLEPGENYTWNILWNKKLSDLLSLNLSYFGRKSEETKIIHSGSIELKAIF